MGIMPRLITRTDTMRWCRGLHSSLLVARSNEKTDFARGLFIFEYWGGNGRQLLMAQEGKWIPSEVCNRLNLANQVKRWLWRSLKKEYARFMLQSDSGSGGESIPSIDNYCESRPNVGSKSEIPVLRFNPTGGSGNPSGEAYARHFRRQNSD